MLPVRVRRAEGEGCERRACFPSASARPIEHPPPLRLCRGARGRAGPGPALAADRTQACSHTHRRFACVRVGRRDTTREERTCFFPRKKKKSGLTCFGLTCFHNISLPSHSRYRRPPVVWTHALKTTATVNLQNIIFFLLKHSVHGRRKQLRLHPPARPGLVARRERVDERFFQHD